MYKIQNLQKDNYEAIVEFNLEEYGYKNTELAFDTIFHEVQWWGNTELLEWHHNLLKETGGDILIIKEDNNIIGQVDYIIEKNTSKPYAHIFWLLIHKDHRKKGLAHKLLLEVKKITMKQQIDRIQVEPEDDRSLSLYAKYGTLEKQYSNWELYFEDIDITDSLQPHGQQESFDNLSMSDFQTWKRVIGQYNTPTFDLLELFLSKNTVAEYYIWGDTYPPTVVNYEFAGRKYRAILTQYLRIYTENECNYQDLEVILNDAIHILHAKNYMGINIQIYHDENLEQLLEKLGFEKEYEDLDEIFILQL